MLALLSEPNAAALAFAVEKAADILDKHLLVYDLGGGTFDVALVRIVEGDLTVIDHEGDNYLGGSDFDAFLLEKVIVPELARRGTFSNLLRDLRSESGKYNKLWTVLLHKAEEAKIELSTKSSAEIDLGLVRGLVDDNGKPLDSIITVTRSEFEEAIKEAVDATADMMKRIVTRNSLQSSDLKFVLMVGGATYSPYVRIRIEQLMGIPVNTSIDPTNAVVVGAAYFAGTKEIASEPIGNRLMFSTPHASTTSSAPDEIMFAARFTANWLEPHCESTVELATSGERPAVSHAVRVTLNACAPTLLMHPPITWPTAADGTFARFRTSTITWASISVGCALDSAPFFLPMGDRPASTITTSRMTLLRYTEPGPGLESSVSVNFPD